MNSNPDIPIPAAHTERVRGADGKAYWKLTCVCGKVLLAPAESSHTQGRCPKCGKSLLFPTERPITSGPLPVIPARRPEKSKASLRSPNTSRRPTPQPPSRATGSKNDRDSSKDRINPGLSASDVAADKLRPPSSRSMEPAEGRISAWPAAEMAPRALAAFIDMTFAVASIALLLAAAPHLPSHFSTGTFRVAFALIVPWLNEGLLQWLYKGSIGKKICVIVLREEKGEPLQIENALLRPFLKLALLPTWPLVLFDPSRRAWHDRILGTVVLKGRA